jgi:hypothetical protein
MMDSYGITRMGVVQQSRVQEQGAETYRGGEDAGIRSGRGVEGAGRETIGIRVMIALWQPSTQSQQVQDGALEVVGICRTAECS